MIRAQIKALENWKKSNNRKPLIIQGARQVGKTWLMNQFGRTSYSNIAYINFESATPLQALFANDFNIARIISVIEIETKQKIQPDKTLIIFDEIQEAERGLTALKYFYEQAPEYHVMAAGSLLGISMQNGSSFPVGKVDLLQLHPLSFLEFITNLGEERLADELAVGNWPVISVFHEKLTDLLRLYYFVGGMPEVVAAYSKDKDLELCRSLQEKILKGYENDFGKHAPPNFLARMRMVWQNLVSQLAKENKKFIYGQLKAGARAKEFESAINWLADAGLVIKVSRIEKATLPLQAYADFDAFKLYFVDIGLLCAMANLEASVLLKKSKILSEFKGALSEQFVCQQLNSKSRLYYWSAAQTAEVDFVVQKHDAIIPIEVKAEENLKSKSLKVFVDKFGNKNAIRLSMSPYRTQDWLTNIPLYGAGHVA
ncbi:MAG: ATP-binding protein [Cytophagales bacterium]|nr:ATP-binding protein [Cytophagales bacterium]